MNGQPMATCSDRSRSLVLDVVNEKVYSQPGARHDCLGRWPVLDHVSGRLGDLLVALAGR